MAVSNIYNSPSFGLQKAIKELGISKTHQTVKVSDPEVASSPFYRSTVTLQLSDKENVVAVGDGYTEPYAKKAADIHALAKMHKAGLLAIIWGDSPAPQKEDKPGAGISDTFNYAARYGCIPEYSFEKIGRFYTLNIRMPEHGIDVTASAKDVGVSELRANFEFKVQAERYHRQEGTELVKDKTALTSDNASDFLRFCDAAGEGRATVRTVQSERIGARGACESIVEINGKKFGPLLIHRGGKRVAERTARLVAAVSLVREKPQLWEKFKATGMKVVGPMTQTAKLALSRSVIQRIMALNASTPETRKKRQDLIFQRAEKESLRQSMSKRMLNRLELEEKSFKLQQMMASYQHRPDLEKLRHTRSQLPMSQYAHQVREIVQNNIYCVIMGATGSGKTTQVPQILFDQAIENGTGASCNIVCTQPRRIAATSVARRVADERAEKLQHTIGYHVRFDAKPPQPSGSILFCTTGVLLQQLQVDHDEVYDRVSHLVIDEVHERDVIIDFLLIMIKKTMALRVSQGKTVPRVVLMSATIDAKRFTEYFKDSLPGPVGLSTQCPTLSVPGRTFPVEERYLTDVLQELERKHGPDASKLWTSHKDTMDYLAAEADKSDNNMPKPIIDWQGIGNGDSDDMVVDRNEALVPLGLAAATIAHLAKTTAGGAILVFLPGLNHITKLSQMLRDSAPLGVNFNDETKFRIFMLHSSVTDQKTVFENVPVGCRKIVLSTNIAETSVTIPDVQYVVDTGKCREKQYDQMRRMTQLQCTWISKSNVKQRAGRAGRVQNGNYYALYTKSRYESMKAVGLAELLRSELLEICLDVKAQRFQTPVREFLADAIEPPPGPAVDNALESLKGLGALTEEEELTPLGRLLASLPVHPALGKMIVLGIIFRCLDPMIIIGAAAGERQLIAGPPTELRRVDDTRKRLAGNSNSDHVMVLEAFHEAREANNSGYQFFRQVCSQNFINPGAFQSIRSSAKDILDVLCEAGLIRHHDRGHDLQYGGRVLNENSHNQAMIKALLLAGLYPNIAMQKPNPKRVIFRTRDEHYTAIHISSVNSRALQKGVIGQQLLTFSELALASEGNVINMRDTTFLTPLMALLFGGQLSFDPRKCLLKLDEWMAFAIMGDDREPAALAKDISLLRQNLDRMLAIAFNDLARRQPLDDNDARTKLADGVATILRLSTPRPGGPFGASQRRINHTGQAYRIASGHSQHRGTSHRRLVSVPSHPRDTSSRQAMRWTSL